jgi:hypothetical protein
MRTLISLPPSLLLAATGAESATKLARKIHEELAGADQAVEIV